GNMRMPLPVGVKPVVEAYLRLRRGVLRFGFACALNDGMWWGIVDAGHSRCCASDRDGATAGSLLGHRPYGFVPNPRTVLRYGGRALDSSDGRGATSSE